MSGVDTLAEAVKRLAAEATHEAWEVDALATLYALLAERDAALILVDMTRDAAMGHQERAERMRAALRDIASGRYSNIMLPSDPPQDPAVVRARAALAKEFDND